MSTLMQLTNEQLDEVTGGWCYSYSSVSVTKIAGNLNGTSQNQTNVAALAVAEVGGNQSNETNQVAIA